MSVENLCSREEVRRLLSKYGLAPRKGYGQNFLVNPAVPQRIAESSYGFAAEACGGEICRPAGVIEIGPGVGALTARLAEYYDRVAALEIDSGLIPLLGESLDGYGNVKVICCDVMKTDIPALLREEFGDLLDCGGTVSVCANLPYYITSPVIMKLLESFPFAGRVPFAAITVMIQTEVADRLAAEPGSSEYGAITAQVALRAHVRKLFNVSAGNFHPAPKVSSSVVSIVPHGGVAELYPNAGQELSKPELLGRRASELISLAFGQRRKTLVNAASHVYDREKLAGALEALGFRADIRGEKLSAADYLALADMLQTD